MDSGALVRISSNGRPQAIEIEIFRWAIERLLSGEVVTQAAINENCKVRASSGIVLILSELPMFERRKHFAAAGLPHGTLPAGAIHWLVKDRTSARRSKSWS